MVLWGNNDGRKKVVVYSNSVNLSMQIFDLSMSFNVNHPNGQVDEKVQVFMSPQHAKLFSQILSENILKYEEVFGSIPTPPSEQDIVFLKEKGLVNVRDGVVGK